MVDEHPGWADAQQQVAASAPALATLVTDRIVVDQALAALPEEFRAPIVLRDQLGMDYAEIAEVLELAPGTVRSRIARGRRKLAGLLTEADISGNQATDPQRHTERS